jgi:hypothetical protein
MSGISEKTRNQLQKDMEEETNLWRQTYGENSREENKLTNEEQQILDSYGYNGGVKRRRSRKHRKSHKKRTSHRRKSRGGRRHKKTHRR